MDQFPFSLADFNRTLMTHLQSLGKSQTDHTCVSGSSTIWIMVLLVLIITSGLVGNVLSLVVLGSYRYKTGTEHMLMYLAVCDMILLVDAIFYIAYIKFMSCGAYSMPTYNPLRAFVHVVFLHTQLMGILALVYLSVERYVAVCRPLSSRSFCTVGRAKRAMKWITGLVIVYYLHTDIYYMYGEKYWHNNVTYVTADWIVTNIVDPLIVSILPLFVLSFLNTKLMTALIRYPHAQMNFATTVASDDNSSETIVDLNSQGAVVSLMRNRSLLGALRRNRSLVGALRRPNTTTPKSNVPTIKVISIVMLFLVTQIVQSILFYIERYWPNMTTWDDVRTVAFTRFVFITLNSSLNCVIYSLCSRKFRWKLRNRFRCDRKKQERPRRRSYRSYV